MGEIFWEDFLGGYFWEELLSRNYQGIDVFVKILSQCTRKEGREFRSLEVRGKLIALKNNTWNIRRLVDETIVPST